MGTLNLFPRYIINLGFWKGAKIFFQAELLKLERVNLGADFGEIFLRPRTSDLPVFREVFLFKSYNLNLDHPSVIIDAGANIGLSTVFLARCYPSAKILAIEPDPSNYAQLLKNTKSIERVVPVKSALWMQDAFLRIKNLHEAQWMLQVEECSPNEDHAFRAVSISSLLRDHHIHRIDLLKLDVESSEKEIFSAHYEEWITKTKYILVELHDWMKDGCSKSLFRTISLYNFKTTIFNGMLLLENLDLA